MRDHMELTGKGSINKGLIFVIIFVIMISILHFMLFGSPILLIIGLPVALILSILSLRNIVRAMRRKKFIIYLDRIEYFENDVKQDTIPVEDIDHVEVWRSLIKYTDTSPYDVSIIKIYHSKGEMLAVDLDILEITQMNDFYFVLTDLSNENDVFEVRYMGMN